MLTLVAPNATLKGSSDGSFSALEVSTLIVNQVGDTVSIALAVNVPYQNNVTGKPLPHYYVTSATIAQAGYYRPSWLLSCQDAYHSRAFVCDKDKPY